MFFASFEKMFLLFGIIAAVWYGFKFLSAVERARSAANRPRQPSQSRQQSSGRQQSQPGRANQVAEVEETVKCRVCGAYLPARQPARCSRTDCPF